MNNRQAKLSKYLLIALVLSMLAILLVVIPAELRSQNQSIPLYVSCGEVVSGLPSSTPSHLIIWLHLNNIGALQGLLNEIYYDPTSVHFHNFITPQQFDEEFSPPSSIINSIEGVLEGSGLTINYVFPMMIEASGSASNVDNALSALQKEPSNVQSWIIVGECIPLGYFIVNSTLSFTPQYHKIALNVTNPRVLFSNITYVNNIPTQIRYRMIEIWLPQGLEYIYDEYPLISSGYNGGGLSIGIVDAFGDFNIAKAASSLTYSSVACNDLITFSKYFDLPSPSCEVIYPLGKPILTSNDLSEAEGWVYESALDIEYAHAMAPGAKIILAVSPDSGDDLFTTIEYLVNNGLVNFISLSWASPEDAYLLPPPAPQLLQAYDEVFMQAAAEGIGVFAASGDWGAFDLFVSPIEPSVWYPASDPWVTGVGGTTLRAVLSQYVINRVEYAWDWNTHYEWGSGGGYSFVFSETPGQSLVSITYERSVVYEPALGAYFYTVGHRGVPDVAADADPFTGVLLIVNGALSPYVFGGTSLATPLTAGMTTTIQSYLGYPYIGDLAPSLYLLYHYYPSQFYVQNATVPSSQYLVGLNGGLFENLGGENGLYWVIQGEWNPVVGLGQLNVYGLSSLIKELIH
ncbi:MAG: S53 family peptidase [Caldivirga sp.]|uniref:S53 family peptidase n=1 Tax=Caldivirga sp. TaxID=2080243 RepID=UPI003D0FA9BA